MPMVVFFGTGPDRQAADNMASKCALGYLRTQLHVTDPVTSDRDGNKKRENNKNEREVVVLQVVDADECDATIKKLEGEVTRTKKEKIKHGQTKPNKKPRSPQAMYERYPQNKPTTNHTNKNSKKNTIKVKTKAELKQLDTQQTNNYASSQNNSESNESFSSMD